MMPVYKLRTTRRTAQVNIVLHLQMLRCILYLVNIYCIITLDFQIHIELNMLHAFYAQYTMVLFLYTFSRPFGTSYGSLMSNISADVVTYCPTNDKGHPQSPQDGTWGRVILSCCDTCLTSPPCGLRKPCCPGVTSHVNNITLSCKRINYKRYDIFYPSFTYWMVTSCKPEFYGTDLEQKCHNEKMADLLDLDSVRPVLDTDTEAIYSNIYCARCNALNNTVDENFFTNQMACTERGTYGILSATTVSGLFPHLLIHCQIRFQPRDISLVNISTCLKQNILNSCNMTGLWKKYDPYIEHACNAYQRPYVDKRNVFRNVHCYLCNTVSPPAVFDEMCKYTPEFGFWGKFSFLALMEPTVRETVALPSNCPPWSVYDPYKDICRNVSCPPLSVQTENGCTPTFYAFSQGLKLRLSLLWKEILPNETAKDVTMDLAGNAFQNRTEEMKNVAFDILQKELVGLFPIEFTYYACTLSVFADSNDKDGTWMIISFVWTIKNATHRVIPDAALKLAIDHSGYGRKMFINLAGEEKQFNVSITGLVVHSSHHVNIHNRRLKRVVWSVYDACSKIYRYIPMHIDVAKIQACSHIELLEDEYEKLPNKMIFVKASKTYLSKVEYIDVRLSLRVCVDDYIPQIVQVLPVVAIHKQVIAIMSFVCSLISIACLLVTIVTISVCPRLQTLPMKLCFCLSATLLAAQTLQQFAIDQIHLQTECIIFGAFIHFFWLKTLFWMNACSFHFFHLFVLSHPKTRNFITEHALLVYFIYTCAASVLIVVTNICWAGFETAWENVGYGGDICYISSPNRLIYTFTIPAAVILLGNAVFLISTIITLAKLDVPGDYSNIQRNYIKIFLKLSTLTGVYWIFGFFKIWTGLVVFEYLFTLFNASQGVFLMVSFVCNNEVLGWYADKFPTSSRNSTSRYSIS